ncbi:RimK/LysX family protein [Stutzerimonas balearica]|uniref:putative ATP-dependent zinc protease n=1 Tax=Stutzerimonas balearica TaxID=74829 RepID=UPI000C35F7FF|nr:hypothetical protein [Pseudomonas sp.]|tara:strand:+ start:132 stop:503 length:372 start_codon:yes stop_codon:yes gene_type:complete
MAEEPRLYGRYENIRVEPLSQVLPAKMDTGAMTASLSATDIQRFERDGQPWVRFRLAVEDAGDTWGNSEKASVYRNRLPVTRMVAGLYFSRKDFFRPSLVRAPADRLQRDQTARRGGRCRGRG